MKIVKKASLSQLFLTAMAAILILGGGIYFYAQEAQNPQWKTYQNTKHGFEFKYPKDWFLDETVYTDPVAEVSDEIAVTTSNDPSKARGYFYISTYKRSGNYSKICADNKKTLSNQEITCNETVVIDGVRYGKHYTKSSEGYGEGFFSEFIRLYPLEQNGAISLIEAKRKAPNENPDLYESELEVILSTLKTR